VEHKDLRLVLDAMIRTTKLSFEKSGTLLPFAVALNDEGKIRQLSFPERPDRSAAETARFIETGLKMLAQQLTCKAVGFFLKSVFRTAATQGTRRSLSFWSTAMAWRTEL
jgi:hypothetical protein